MFIFAAFVIAMCRVTTAAHNDLEMVDLTHMFDETTQNWPGQKKFKMEFTLNETVKAGYWLQMEEYSSGTHVGTSMCSPLHFAKGKWSIDQIPLSHLIAPAAVIDITERAEEDPDASVEVRDLENWERISGQSLNDTIIMIRSGWSKRWSDWESYSGTSGEDATQFHYPGMSERGAQWLVDNRKIYGVGSDSLTLDNGASAGVFMAHRILLKENIYCLENVANVEELPIYGAMLHVFPMKIGRSSGAPVRIIATYPKRKVTNEKNSVTESVTWQHHYFQ